LNIYRSKLNFHNKETGQGNHFLVIFYNLTIILVYLEEFL